MSWFLHLSDAIQWPSKETFRDLKKRLTKGLGFRGHFFPFVGLFLRSLKVSFEGSFLQKGLNEVVFAPIGCYSMRYHPFVGLLSESLLVSL